MIDEDEARVIDQILNLLSDGRPQSPWKIPEQIDPMVGYAPGSGASPELEDAAAKAVVRGRLGMLAIIEKMVNDLGLLKVIPMKPDDLVVISKQGSAWLKQRR